MQTDKASLKIDVFLSVFVFFAAWIFYALNTWNGDRDAYELYYMRDGISAWRGEIIYGYMNIFFNKLGVGFQAFQAIVASLTLLITWLYFRKVSYYLSISFILYLILMLPLDYVLMRTTLAYSIVIYGLYLKFYKHAYLYVLFIIVATLIHQSAFFFIGDANKIGVQSFRLIFLLLFSTIIASFMLYKLDFVPLSIQEHIAYYRTNYKTSVFNVCLHLASTLIMYLNYNYLKNTNRCGRYDDFILSINCVSMLLLATYIYADIFVRLFRLICFINLIYLVQWVFLNKLRASLYAFIYFALFSFYLFYYFVYKTASLSILPMLYCNYIPNYIFGVSCL
uniref:Wzy n=3 Tax=Plesiomonas shigelloides TaxID=703 RepID=W0FU10_PLESH|nr:Wzy [Plesiomonas shigelloides]